MARYYFNTRDDDLARDDEGIECDDLDAVRAPSVAKAREP